VSQINAATPPRLTVTAWADPVIESLGHRPGSPYVEAVWLGVLGPSTTWAWQRLARLVATKPGTTIDTADLAVSLGLGAGTGPHAAISRTLSRLVSFDVAHRGADTLAVRLALPDMPARRLLRLSRSARFAHGYLAHRPGAPSWPKPTGPEAEVDHPTPVVAVSP
jgi:hypothetical protein